MQSLEERLKRSQTPFLSGNGQARTPSPTNRKRKIELLETFYLKFFSMLTLDISFLPDNIYYYTIQNNSYF